MTAIEAADVEAERAVAALQSATYQRERVEAELRSACEREAATKVRYERAHAYARALRVQERDDSEKGA